MKIIKRVLLISIGVALSACSTATPSLSQNSNYGHTNYKYFPYKSAIIKYEFDRDGDNYKKVRIWDNWGIQWWEESETRYKDSPIPSKKIIFKDNGTKFYVNYHHKKIRKSRDLIQDVLLATNEDLSNYYVEFKFKRAFFYHSDFRRSGKTEMIAGKKCNIWESEKTRLCMYKDLILLKSEAYFSRQKKWIIQQKAVSAQFNVVIDKSLFKLPNFPIEVDVRYISDNKKHKIIRENLREVNELVQRIKATGKRIKDKMKNSTYVRD